MPGALRWLPPVPPTVLWAPVDGGFNESGVGGTALMVKFESLRLERGTPADQRCKNLT